MSETEQPRKSARPFGITQADLDNWFSYHQPFGSQVQRYQVIREEFKHLAEIIVAYTPTCPDQTAALRKLREAAMAVNQCIACNEEEDDADQQ